MSAPEPPEHAMSVTDRSPLTHLDPHRLRNRAFIAACAIITIGAVTGTVLLLTSGSTKPGSQAPSPPVAATPSSGPSTTSTAEQLAIQQAEARYATFIQTTDEVAQSGYIKVRLYDNVAIATARIQLLLEARRAGPIHSIGSTEIASVTVQSVSIPNDSRKAFPEVRLVACLDVSKVDVVDARGRSVVSPNRPARVRSEAVLQKIPRGAFAGDAKRSGWFVHDVTQRGTPC
jgi:hypothetical protein